jgi:acylphosphatase
MKHFSIRVAGKVQGVFFRASTKDVADDLKIKGTVRNNPDGSVSIEAEGDEEKLNQFIDWCRHGPRHARVDQFEVKESAGHGFRDFAIVR